MAVGLSTLAKEPILADLMTQQQLDRLLAEAIKSAGKGKGVRKVAPSTMASLAKPLFRLLGEGIQGLIEGACKYKQLLSK